MKGQKAIGCTLCAITCFLLIAAISNAEWAKSEGWREGLFEQCVDKGSATPFPFFQPIEMAANIKPPFMNSSCHARIKLKMAEDGSIERDLVGNGIPEKDESGEYVTGMPKYMKTTLALLVIGLLIDILGTVLTGMSLKGADWEKNQKFTIYAIGLFAIAVIILLGSAVVFAINFTAEQEAAGVKYDGCMDEWSVKKCGNVTKVITETDDDDDVTIDADDITIDENLDEIPDVWQARADQKRTFYFGFCFGVTILSAVFLLIGIVLLTLDHFNPDPKEEEEGQEMKAA